MRCLIESFQFDMQRQWANAWVDLTKTVLDYDYCYSAKTSRPTQVEVKVGIKISTKSRKCLLKKTTRVMSNYRKRRNTKHISVIYCI